MLPGYTHPLELTLSQLVTRVAEGLSPQQAKVVMFSLAYGSGPAEVARKVGLTEAEAQRLATLWKERNNV